jgi:hypothetical protein
MNDDGLVGSEYVNDVSMHFEQNRQNKRERIARCRAKKDEISDHECSEYNYSTQQYCADPAGHRYFHKTYVDCPRDLEIFALWHTMARIEKMKKMITAGAYLTKELHGLIFEASQDCREAWYQAQKKTTDDE